ncbi:phosphoribosylglycinamide formyltransferase [Companilactobacillus ginsenosidimutans]|uniref:Phosphoribosylglycinamide formyltransferase n=1 Tax=Companilactobacillus ginsenosidimutans TaxID=1007676 RepID=A0A0H4QE80_9LACO|nr:phosphoribosylglycinamide formyltransferase [Companilactobacillus ginsenosidimutans]AKP66679.1 phosphoribosylglycinamide formyltransferase [Companilactobacillus ginsenosidimutans]
MRVAVFASGNGTNFEALADDEALKTAGLDIVILVCDKPNAPVLDKARQRGIPVFVNQLKNYSDRHEYEQAIVDKLSALDIEYILLAGYMKVITSTLLSKYQSKIINIHPSILPKYSGLESIERAFNAGEKETGVTVHYIDDGVDTGPIIRQATVPIYEDDTVDTLEARVHETEHKIYPEVVLELLKK